MSGFKGLKIAFIKQTKKNPPVQGRVVGVKGVDFI